MGSHQPAFGRPITERLLLKDLTRLYYTRTPHPFHFHKLVYRVSQEERLIFWEVIVSVILSKNVCMNMFPIPNGFRDSAI